MPALKQDQRSALKKIRRLLAKAHQELSEWPGEWPVELSEAEGMVFGAGMRLDYLYAGKPKFDQGKVAQEIQERRSESLANLA